MRSQIAAYSKVEAVIFHNVVGSRGVKGINEEYSGITVSNFVAADGIIFRSVIDFDSN